MLKGKKEELLAKSKENEKKKQAINAQKEYRSITDNGPMIDVRSPSGISKAEIERVTTEKGRGIDENVDPRSGMDETRALKLYTQQITGVEVASELVMENKEKAKELYMFVNGKEPTTEQMAKMISASIAYTKLHPTSEIPGVMAKRESLLKAPKGNTMARETVRE